MSATALLSTLLISPLEALYLALIGSFGGFLPDIDSDNSHALTIIFTLISVIFSFITVIFIYNQVSVLELWLAAAAVFLFNQYCVRALFERLTVHRGNYHSLLACVLFSLLSVATCHFLKLSDFFSWAAGTFTFLGMLTHLVLDEIYSVDLMNISIKRSFGSAIKPMDISYPWTCAFFLSLSAALIYYVPSPQEVIHAMQKSEPGMRFLPDWLKFL